MRVPHVPRASSARCAVLVGLGVSVLGCGNVVLAEQSAGATSGGATAGVSDGSVAASSGSGGNGGSAGDGAGPTAGSVGGAGGMVGVVGGAGGVGATVGSGGSGSSGVGGGGCVIPDCGTGGNTDVVKNPAVAYQIDVAHTGSQSGALVPPLAQKWAKDLGGRVSYPIIAGGRVFVTVGTATGTKLQAFDEHTGAELWPSIDLPSTFRWSAAAYDDGKLFVMTNDARLHAYKASTGQELWWRQIGFFAADSFSPPAASDGMVFVSSGSWVYGVSQLDGSILWKAAFNGTPDSSPAVSATAVYASFAAQQVYAFDPKTGALLWHPNTPGVGGGASTPALFEGRLYSRDWATPNRIFDAATGSTIGPFAADPIPAFQGTRMFTLSGSSLQAIDLATMSVAWTFQGDGMLTSAPIVVNGYVYEGSSLGNLYALDAQTGAVVWSDVMGASIDDPEDNGPIGPTTGLAAGEDVLIVPAHTWLVAY